MCDHINAVGRILNVSITQPCLALVLQQENVLKGTKNKKSEEGSRKRKSLLIEIEELKEKK